MRSNSWALPRSSLWALLQSSQSKGRDEKLVRRWQLVTRCPSLLRLSATCSWRLSAISSQTDELSERKAQAQCSPPTSSSRTESSLVRRWRALGRDFCAEADETPSTSPADRDGSFTGGSRRKLHRRVDEDRDDKLYEDLGSLVGQSAAKLCRWLKKGSNFDPLSSVSLAL